MNVFIFIAVIVFLASVIGPLAKGLGDRLARGGGGDADLRRLAAELERAEQRIADAERRLNDAEERLDFQEKLLGPPT
jgi:hypothetical protein